MAAVAAHFASWNFTSDRTAKTSSGVAAYSIDLAIFMRLLLSRSGCPPCGGRRVASVATSPSGPRRHLSQPHRLAGHELGGCVDRSGREDGDDGVATGDGVVGEEERPAGRRRAAGQPHGRRPRWAARDPRKAAARTRGLPSSRTPTRSLVGADLPGVPRSARRGPRASRSGVPRVSSNVTEPLGRGATGATSTRGSPAGRPTGRTSPALNGAGPISESVSYERDPSTGGTSTPPRTLT